MWRGGVVVGMMMLERCWDGTSGGSGEVYMGVKEMVA